MKRVFGVVASVLVMLAALLVTQAIEAVAGTAGDCTSSTESPHYSSTAGGVIAKSRWVCQKSNPIPYQLYLYKCPNKPASNKTAVMDNCTLQKKRESSFTHPGGGATVTRYVPIKGAEPAHGCGYWAQINRWCLAYACAPVTDVRVRDTYLCG